MFQFWSAREVMDKAGIIPEKDTETEMESSDSIGK